jgi:hypothetical protein
MTPVSIMRPPGSECQWFPKADMDEYAAGNILTGLFVTAVIVFKDFPASVKRLAD